MGRDHRVRNIVLGDAEVIRVIDWHEPFLPTSGFLPDVAAEVSTANADGLTPKHWQPDDDRMVIALQTWGASKRRPHHLGRHGCGQSARADRNGALVRPT